jgi:hypothetical protein
MSSKSEDTRDVEPRRRPSYHAVPHPHRDSLHQKRIDTERLKASCKWTDKIPAPPTEPTKDDT